MCISYILLDDKCVSFYDNPCATSNHDYVQNQRCIITELLGVFGYQHIIICPLYL